MLTVIAIVMSAMLAALSGTVVFRMLTGRIDLRGLTGERRAAPVAPERVQALLVAFAAPLAYATLVLCNLRESVALGALPEPPDWILFSSAGSQVLYLAGKISRSATNGQQ